MSFGDEWATFDSIYGGAPEPSSSTWYDGALDAVGSVYDKAVSAGGSWLDNLLEFELKKDLLGYQSQLQQQASLLGTVESEQQTGNVPSSPNYRQVPVNGTAAAQNGNAKLLLVAAAAVAAYYLVK